MILPHIYIYIYGNMIYIYIYVAISWLYIQTDSHVFLYIHLPARRCIHGVICRSVGMIMALKREVTSDPEKDTERDTYTQY